MKTAKFSAFLSCAPKFESHLTSEISSILHHTPSFQSSTPHPSLTTKKGEGCELSGLSLNDLHHLICYSRLSSSIRLRLSPPFKATHFNHFIRGISHIPWQLFFPLKSKKIIPIISVSCKKSALYHSTAVEERLCDFLVKKKFISKAKLVKEKQFISEALEAEKDLDQLQDDKNNKGNNENTMKIYVRIVDDVVQVSLDVTGDRISKRGYRSFVNNAPLRENLAASCLDASSYTNE